MATPLVIADHHCVCAKPRQKMSERPCQGQSMAGMLTHDSLSHAISIAHPSCGLAFGQAWPNTASPADRVWQAHRTAAPVPEPPARHCAGGPSEWCCCAGQLAGMQPAALPPQGPAAAGCAAALLCDPPGSDQTSPHQQLQGSQHRHESCCAMQVQGAHRQRGSWSRQL